MLVQPADRVVRQVFAEVVALSGFSAARTSCCAPARHETMPSWDSIPEDERPFQRRLMEVAAGFTEHVDVRSAGSSTRSTGSAMATIR